jgi:hypothetical protein
MRRDIYAAFDVQNSRFGPRAASNKRKYTVGVEYVQLKTLLSPEENMDA